jgi:hypothetical protein
MSMRYDRVLAILLCCSFIGCNIASANDLPSVNLGLTSFLDGVLPSGTGLYYQNYAEFYTSSRFEDSGGHRAPLPRQDVRVWVDINQFTYYANTDIGPGRLAVDVVIPTIISARVDDGLVNAVLKAQAGIGDVLFGPIYQFNAVTLPNHSVLWQSVEFDVLAPTGAYDRHLAVNPGSHAWAIDPFYAATLFMTPNLSVSGRFHYLYNFTNDSPNESLGPAAHTLQAGQAFHFNLAVAYAIAPHVGLGLNAYYLKQFTNSKINGESTTGRSERVLGVGPGTVITLDENSFLFVNVYTETLVENRTEGERVLVRFIHHF